MRIYSMKTRNPVVAVLLIVTALGALALAFMVGIILLTTLAVAGTLIGAGFIIRNKLRRGRDNLVRGPSARAQLDPSMEVRPDRELLPPGDSDER
jgi:hypothetical protein